MLVDNAPEGWLAIQYATRALGVSRQTILQRVKRGELQAVLTRTGRRKGLRIKVPNHKTNYFDHDNQRTEQCDNASKNFWMSRSMTQSLFQHRSRHAPTASRADRRGRYP